MKNRGPYYDLSMWKGAPASSFGKARALRKNLTPAEQKLWDVLKQNACGYKFRCQHPIHLFIADFYCHQLKLIIEIDGEYHNIAEQQKKDQERTELLNLQEVEVIRFTNDEVLHDLKEVLLAIRLKIATIEAPQ